MIEKPPIGIILVAGMGTRMGAATRGISANGSAVSKALLETYDKPTIYYALSSLISAGIREIMIIAAPGHVDNFKSALGDGTEMGIELEYSVQLEPKGIAEAFIIGEGFIGDRNVALIFGDNIFSGERFAETLRGSTKLEGNANIFALHSEEPQHFGVVTVNAEGKGIKLVEKPTEPESNLIVPGVYFFPHDVVEISKTIRPSARGELEITSVNQVYLEQGRLNVTRLDSDTIWFDTGNPDALLEAGIFVQKYQKRTGRLLGSPEAEAFLVGFIDAGQLMKNGVRLEKSDYGQSLIRLAEGKWDL